MNFAFGLKNQKKVLLFQGSICSELFPLISITDKSPRQDWHSPFLPEGLIFWRFPFLIFCFLFL